MLGECLYSWLSNVENYRFLSSIGIIAQIIGIIIPGFLAILLYIIKSKQKAREDVIGVFDKWNDSVKSDQYVKATEIIKSYNKKEISFSDILDDESKHRLVTTLLNELEFLSMYIRESRKRSFRRKLARKYFAPYISDYWKGVEGLVYAFREHLSSPFLYGDLEKLHKEWDG